MRVRTTTGWSVVLLAGPFAAIAGPVAVADDAPADLIWD